jgi:hypothetical protein
VICNQLASKKLGLSYDTQARSLARVLVIEELDADLQGYQ